MKRTTSHNILKTLGILGLFLVAGFASHAFAMQPTLTLSSQTVSYVQLSVYGDPNSSVSLEYQSGYGLQNAGAIGYTNSSGYFTTSLTSTNYNIPAGQQVFVLVDNQQSQSVTWPYSYTNYNNYSYTNYSYPTNYSYGYNYYTTPTISLSQNNVSLSTGQTSTVSIFGTGSNNYYNYNSYNNYGNSYYVYSYSNPATATATLTGNVLSIYAMSPGTSSIVVCPTGSYGGYNSSCATVAVTVSGYGNYNYNYGYGYPYGYNSYNYSYPYYY